MTPEIPIPDRCSARRLYDFGVLEVGQTHLFENPNISSVQVAACKAGKKLNRKFVTRKVKGGVRVWRVA